MADIKKLALGPAPRRQAPNPQIGPSLGGLGKAVESFGQAISDHETLAVQAGGVLQKLDQAYQERQRKVDRSQATVGLIKLRQQLNEARLQIQDQVGPGTPEYLDAVAKTSAKMVDDFKKSLPAHLRNEFDPRLASLTVEQRASSLTEQITAENNIFKSDLNDLLAMSVSDISTAPGDPTDLFESAKGTMLNLINDSPLNKTDQALLAEDVIKKLREAELARASQDEALGRVFSKTQVPGGIVHKGAKVMAAHGKPVLAGLPKTAVGLLSIIMKFESGGVYNIMFGQRTFTDFSKHPNSAKTITEGDHKGNVSTAAGAYQIIKATWDRVKNKLGLPDFSPESQDMAAWEVAKDDYTARTGQDLDLVLRSGNFAAIAEARKVLSKTWEGLKHVTDEDFYKAITETQGNPASILVDPEYKDIPMTDRQNIVMSAQSQADQLIKNQLDAMQAQRNTIFEGMRQQIFDGTAQDLSALLDQGKQAGFTVDQLQKIEKEFTKRAEDSTNAQTFAASISTPGFLPHPSSVKYRDSVSAYVQDQLSQGVLTDGSPEDVRQRLIVPLTKGQYIPPALVTKLFQDGFKQDAQVAERSWAVLEAFQREAPFTFARAVTDQQNQLTALYSQLKETMPHDQLFDVLRNAADPTQMQAREQRLRMFKDLQKDTPIFTPEKVRRDFGIKSFGDPLQEQQFMSEYMPLVREMFVISGDVSGAKHAAIAVLKQRYGNTVISGKPVFMKYPPESQVILPDGDITPLQEDLQKTVSNLENVSIVSDGTTAVLAESGVVPTYALTRKDEFGLTRQVTLGETNFRDLLGGDVSERLLKRIADLPARWQPETQRGKLEETIGTYSKYSDVGGPLPAEAPKDVINSVTKALDAPLLPTKIEQLFAVTKMEMPETVQADVQQRLAGLLENVQVPKNFERLLTPEKLTFTGQEKDQMFAEMDQLIREGKMDLNTYQLLAEKLWGDW